MTPFADHHRPIIIAHRGGAEASEPITLAVLQRTVKAGYPYLEIDVRATADGKVYIWHGEGRERFFRWLPLNPAHLHADTPLLSDALKAMPNAFFFIDPKHTKAIRPLAEIIANTQTTDRVAINAFAWLRTRRTEQRIYALTGKHVPMGMSVMQNTWVFVKSLVMKKASHASRYSYVLTPHGQTTKGFIRFAHSAGLKVFPWTVNTPEEAARLRAAGADGFITDQPAIVQQVD